MVNIFRDSTTFAEKKCNEVVSDVNIYAQKWFRIAAAKKVLFEFLPPLFTPFTRIVAPTSQIPMSKLFKFSESLEKANGKKWSQI